MKEYWEKGKMPSFVEIFFNLGLLIRKMEVIIPSATHLMEVLKENVGKCVSEQYKAF